MKVGEREDVEVYEGIKGRGMEEMRGITRRITREGTREGRREGRREGMKEGRRRRASAGRV